MNHKLQTNITRRFHAQKYQRPRTIWPAKNCFLWQIASF